MSHVVVNGQKFKRIAGAEHCVVDGSGNAYRVGRDHIGNPKLYELRKRPNGMLAELPLSSGPYDGATISTEGKNGVGKTVDFYATKTLVEGLPIPAGMPNAGQTATGRESCAMVSATAQDVLEAVARAKAGDAINQRMYDERDPLKRQQNQYKAQAIANIEAMEMFEARKKAEGAGKTKGAN